MKFGKGEPQEEQFVQGSSPWDPTNKTNKKAKISKPQIDKQMPLEMGTGGGGRGKKGGSHGKKLPEDKVEMENYPNKGKEDDSSSETSLELDINPQQLAPVGLNRPLLRLRLTPRGRVVAAAPGGGRMPPPLGGGTKTVSPEEGQNGRGSNQHVKGGGGPPQPPNGGGGELAHHSWKGVEECLSDWWVEEELLHLVVMEVVMRMVMTMEGVIDHLP